ncbi:MAG: SPFH domain-containing protein [Planctomycetota bacterium]
MHQHHDDHNHDHDHDEHVHRNPDVSEEPLDAANQSLSDALRSSFSILKGIMLILVVLYLFSNVRRIDSSEQALLLRLGHLYPKPYEPGLVWAFPYPIDEIVPLPTKQSNNLLVKSHSFFRRPEEEGKPLSFIMRGGEGLNPGLDGALVTADTGLVHVQWKVTYKIDDLTGYVSTIKTKELEAAQDLIQRMVETTGIHLAGELTAEEMIRTRVDHVQTEMTRRVNERLKELNSGLTVTRVEMFEPTPPIPVRDAFDNTQKAENTKQTKIRDAEQQRTKLLSEAAGAAYPRVIDLLDAIDRGAPKEGRSVEELRADLGRTLEFEVEGETGQRIKDAGAYFSVVVGRMRGDVELYRTLLPEYERNPRLLIGRLWEETRQRIMKYSGVTKIYRPGPSQFRLHVPLDPEQTRIEEQKKLESKEFDIKKLRPEKFVPVGPEAD